MSIDPKPVETKQEKIKRKLSKKEGSKERNGFLTLKILPPL